MKRDFELIRKLLLELEKLEAGGATDIVRVSEAVEADFQVTKAHLELLVDAGLVKGHAGFSGFIVTALTWEGYDFLDALRSEEAMSKVREATRTLGGVSYDVAKAIGIAWVKDHLGLGGPS